MEESCQARGGSVAAASGYQLARRMRSASSKLFIPSI
jgi:hypothetical protein